jgi:predicted ABC-type ATPase
MPRLYIITGSNGAGKSSVGPEYLPPEIRTKCQVFDGDKLFMRQQKVLWERGMRAHKEIKKLAFAHVEDTFHHLVEAALEKKHDFVYEGHFTNEATWEIPRRFKSEGYSIYMIFMGLSGTKLSELRVLDRTKEGGHYVDPETVESNYYGNLEKLNKHFSIFDHIEIIDSTEIDHITICTISNGVVSYITGNNQIPDWFRNYLPAISSKT